MQEFADAGEGAVPARLREALAGLMMDVRGEHESGLGQLNPQLRKRQYSEAEIAARKRNRRDVRAAVEAAAAAQQ